jgi:hypothetical protein
MICTHSTTPNSNIPLNTLDRRCIVAARFDCVFIQCVVGREETIATIIGAEITVLLVQDGAERIIRYCQPALPEPMKF